MPAFLKPSFHPPTLQLQRYWWKSIYVAEKDGYLHQVEMQQVLDGMRQAVVRSL